jgi:DNA-binding CsgD family transcriptional regulator
LVSEKSINAKIKLTQRELQVLMLVQNHKIDEEIANILSISSRTAEWHRSNLIQKTGSKSTQDLIKWADQNISEYLL